jgi:hypothetical protein
LDCGQPLRKTAASSTARAEKTCFMSGSQG